MSGHSIALDSTDCLLTYAGLLDRSIEDHFLHYYHVYKVDIERDFILFELTCSIVVHCKGIALLAIPQENDEFELCRKDSLTVIYRICTKLHIGGRVLSKVSPNHAKIDCLVRVLDFLLLKVSLVGQRSRISHLVS